MGFEPRISSVGSDRFANCNSTSAILKHLMNELLQRVPFKYFIYDVYIWTLLLLHVEYFPNDDDLVIMWQIFQIVGERKTMNSVK